MAESDESKHLVYSAIKDLSRMHEYMWIINRFPLQETACLILDVKLELTEPHALVELS